MKQERMNRIYHEYILDLELGFNNQLQNKMNLIRDISEEILANLIKEIFL
jgi:hypothetical protein